MQVGEVMVELRVMVSPVSGAPGAVKWNVSSNGVDVERLVKLPLVVSDVVILPDFVRLQVPLRLVPLLEPLSLLLIANVTVKFDPVTSLILAAVGVFRETAILRLSVNEVSACDWLPLAVR